MYRHRQMQAGITGVNTIRIYNPTKNAEEHDAAGEFIKKWVPELKNIPPKQVYEPWKLPLPQQILYNCIIGNDYPMPIVDIEATRKIASDIMWSYRKAEVVNKEGTRILKKHTSQSVKVRNTKPKKNKLSIVQTTLWDVKNFK